MVVLLCEARCRYTALSCPDSLKHPHILYCGDCKTELVDVSRASDTLMLGSRSGSGSASAKFYRQHAPELHLIDTTEGCRHVKMLQTGTSSYARRGSLRLIPRDCFLVLFSLSLSLSLSLFPNAFSHDRGLRLQDVACREGGLSRRHCEAALAADLSTTWRRRDGLDGRQMPPLLLPELPEALTVSPGPVEAKRHE